MGENKNNIKEFEDSKCNFSNIVSMKYNNLKNDNSYFLFMPSKISGL